MTNMTRFSMTPVSGVVVEFMACFLAGRATAQATSGYIWFDSGRGPHSGWSVQMYFFTVASADVLLWIGASFGACCSLAGSWSLERASAALLEWLGRCSACLWGCLKTVHALGRLYKYLQETVLYSCAVNPLARRLIGKQADSADGRNTCGTGDTAPGSYNQPCTYHAKRSTIHSIEICGYQ